jgi:peroxiredoxin
MRHYPLLFLLSALLLVLLLAAPAAGGELPTRAEDVRPLLIGSAVPDTTLHDLEGAPVRLRDALQGRHSMLVFYRGGWCPYCNLQLANLRHITGELAALGVQLIAITPDRPEELAKSIGQGELEYRLLSDTDAATMRGFGIAFRLDEDTSRKYSEYGIDIDAASGATHHALPVPAVFVVDPSGHVRFSYVDPDYTRRAPAEVLLAAARAVMQESDRLEPKL